ncbi:MAG: hypothetical protein IKR25_07910 [Muribaculaceae bacterium]|nr:hypothetical protein [Muribaculaceae bacterium]
MNPLLINVSFPRLRSDMTIAQAQIERSGELPPTDGLPPHVVLDITMTYVRFLMADHRTAQAEQVTDYLVYADEADDMPTHYIAWLWLARMTLFIERNQHTLALGCAENALTHLANMGGKKSDDFLALVASTLYNLAHTHHATGDNSRAAKELTHAQKLFERLAKKDEARFSAMLLYAVQASTEIIQSRTKQMNVLEHYQQATELYTQQLTTGDENQTREAMNSLVDTLKKEGDILLEMGNGRHAVKYYTKALRYQKKLGDPLGLRELQLSIGMAKALQRLTGRRAAAEQLLTSLLPLARRLHASNEVIEIENLLAGKNRNFNIMNLLKSIF